MTKKDYELIAKGIFRHRFNYEGRTDAVVKEVVCDLAQVLSQENTRFNVERFTRACMDSQKCEHCHEEVRMDYRGSYCEKCGELMIARI